MMYAACTSPGTEKTSSPTSSSDSLVVILEVILLSLAHECSFPFLFDRLHVTDDFWLLAHVVYRQLNQPMTSEVGNNLPSQTAIRRYACRSGQDRSVKVRDGAVGRALDGTRRVVQQLHLPHKQRRRVARRVPTEKA